MRRFSLRALFPLIVIVLLVYLASQTLLPRSDEPDKWTYSQLIDQIETNPENFDSEPVIFNPKGRSIEAVQTATDGSETKIKVNYPSDQAQIEFQNLLQEKSVPFDSK